MLIDWSMQKIKFGLLVFTALLGLQAAAQLNTASPYSRFGVGELHVQGGLQNKLSGGTGIGTFDPSYLNTLNPAASSFLAKPTMDAGFYFKNYTLSSNAVSDKASTTGFNHFTFAFPFGNENRFAVAAGVMPFSNVGFKYSAPYTVNGTDATGEFSGNGGIENAFLSGSYQVINKKDSLILSVGAQANYLFGTVQHISNYFLDRNEQYYNFSQNSALTLRDFNFANFGVALSFYPKKESSTKVSIGAVAGLGKNMKAIQTNFDYTFVSSSFGLQSVKDTIQYVKDNGTQVDVPQYFGVGASILFRNYLQVGADYYAQSWSETPVNFRSGTTESVGNRSRLSLSVQYLPESKLLYKESLLKKTYYRFGLYNEQTYYRANGEAISAFGTTFGVGVPIRRSGGDTRLNLGVEYGVFGTTDNNLIKESFTVFYLGVTLQPSNIDRWFYKRKYD